MSDYSSAAQSVKIQKNLSGLCYENTVIDRKGRIRKVKPPPIAKKPTTTQPPRLETYFDEPHRLSPSAKNSNASQVTHSQDVVDNRQFVIGNNNFENPIPTQSWHNQLMDGDKNRLSEHREKVWKERPGTKSVSSEIRSKTQHPDADLVEKANKRDADNHRKSKKASLSTRDSRSLYTDNYYMPQEGPKANATRGSKSQCIEGKVSNARHSNSKYVDNNKDGSIKSVPNAKDKASQGGETIVETKGIGQNGSKPITRNRIPHSPAGSILEKGILQDVDNYKDVLQKNANLNWKPKRVQKHNIKKLDNGISNRNEEFRQPINDIHGDVYEFALNRLEAEDDTDDDDEERNRNADCSQRSESPDTLVERILENVDRDGGIFIDSDEQTVSEKPMKKSRKLQSCKKSFSDEILERLGKADQTLESSGAGPQSELDSRESKTLELVKKNRTDIIPHNATRSIVATCKELNLRTNSSLNSPSKAIKLDTYIIEQERAEKMARNESEYPSQSSVLTESSSVPPSSATGTHLASMKSRDDPRSSRERSPEEIFEEIMESIHDTDADYEEPFFLKAPSLLFTKSSSSTRGDVMETPGVREIDYSVENDWLSFFYCNRINARKDLISTGSTTQEDLHSSMGIFMNASLSASSWIATKPSRNTLPRTSSEKTEPRGGISEALNVTGLSEQRDESNYKKIFENENQFHAKIRPDFSKSLTSDLSQYAMKSDSRLRGPVERSTNKFPDEFERDVDTTVETGYQIRQELTPESVKVSPLDFTSQAQTMEYPPSKSRERPLDAKEIKIPVAGECRHEEVSLVNNIQETGMDSQDATTLLFAALDSAFAHNIEQNRTRFESERNLQPEEEFLANSGGTLTPGESSSADDIAKSCESTIRFHQTTELKHSNESQEFDLPKESQDLHKTSEQMLHLGVDKDDIHKENLPSFQDAEHSIQIGQNEDLKYTRVNESFGKKEYYAPIAFIDETEATERLRRSLLDTIEECDATETLELDANTVDQSEQERTSNEIANIDACKTKDSELDSENSPPHFGEDVVAENVVQSLEPADSDAVQQPPKRTLQVLSDEVTSQTVVLKIAWPAGKRKDASWVQKEQPFRELQLRRTIRMTEPTGRESSAVQTTVVSTLSGNQPQVVETAKTYEKQKNFSLAGKDDIQTVDGKNRNPGEASPLTSRPDVLVEYENQEQSHREEEMDARTFVDVVQTDSVKVLLVPVETSYKVPDLKEIVAAVGQTILQDSNRIPASSHIRVTCEATQSKSCAALKDQDITVINDTIIDKCEFHSALPVHSSIEQG